MKFNVLLKVIALFTMTPCIVNGQSYVPEWKDRKINVNPTINLKAFSINVSDVHLLPSAFTEAMDAEVRYLMKIEPDRLLADFRSHSGLKPKAEKYGGWESSGLAGHTLGHYLSALALYYASTKDAECLKRVNYIVDELEACQQARKTGYIGAIPNEDSLWLEVSQGKIRSRGFDLNGAWSPWYTVHKIMGGLLDAYLYAGSQKALKINTGLADWTDKLLSNLSDSLIQQMLITEYGGMNDALVNTYAFTGNKKYLDLSYKFHDRRILDSLAAGKNVVQGKHSNTQIPKLIGTARRYQLTGNKDDLASASFFWKTILDNYTYATGGNSNYEYLGEPKKLNDKLTDNTTETCNTYNMLKLTRQLFAVQPDVKLMDYYEKALYNHILSSQHHQTGMVTYFVSLRMGGKKEYSDEFNSFTCCVGTGMENHVKYNENIYFRGSDGSMYLNLFIPSVFNWKEKKMQLKMETNGSSAEKVMLTVQNSSPTKAVLRIRKPHWAKGINISINDKKLDYTIDDAGFMLINRTWKNNDQLKIKFYTELYTEAMPDNADRRAIFYGPLLLAGVLGNKEPEPSEIPVLVSDNADPNKWIIRTASNSFQTSKVGTPKDVQLIPFNRTLDEHYTVYWDVFTPAKWADQQKVYEEKRRKQKELENRTTDIFRMGEMQPERDHQFTGEQLESGDEHNRKWRMAKENGFMQFIMKVSPDSLNSLICTYWGMDNRGRIFDILVEGQKIITEDINKFKMSKFYDIAYAIPAELTKGKKTVTVRFVPRQNNSAGPVYGVRMAMGDVKDLTTEVKEESIYK